jgi:choline-sulfatase
VDAALHWLGEKSPALKQPWTLAVNIVAPHFPHITSEELWDLYPGADDLPVLGLECASAKHPYAADLRRHFEAEKFTEQQVRGLRRGYLAGITFVDRQLGRLMEALDKSGQAADTVVIYCSDHGEMLGKFGMWWKSSLYEDSARVPVIVAGPGFAPGLRASTPVDLLDVQAAFFKATGAKRPEDWVGNPLQDIPLDDPHRVIFSEYHGHGTRSGGYLIRKGDWKLLWYAAAPHQLFNLRNDPDELENRYAAEPAKRAELEAELRKICDPERENQRAHAFERGQIETLTEMGLLRQHAR